MGSRSPWRIEQPFVLIVFCLLQRPLKFEWLCPRAVEEQIPIFFGYIHLLLADDHPLLGCDNLFLEGFELLPRFFVFPLPNSAAFDQLKGVCSSIAASQHLVAAHHAGFLPLETF